MKRYSLLAITILTLTFLFHTAKDVSAAELITNGSFETGDFTGWTAVNGAGALQNWINTTGGFDTGFHTSSPQAGTRSVLNGVAGNAGSVFTLTQQITIPAATTAQLTWRHRFQLDNATFCTGAACGSATFSVQILNTSDAVLQTPYTVTVGSEQIYDSGWLINSISLNAYSGQTIRIRFRNTVTQTLAGPGMAEIDAVSVQSPFPPVAAEATVSGQIKSANGNGIRNVVVSLTETNGTTRTFKTNAFGYYNFDGIEVGQTVTLTVNSKRYTFVNPTRIVSVSENVSDIDFTSIE